MGRSSNGSKGWGRVPVPTDKVTRPAPLCALMLSPSMAPGHPAAAVQRRLALWTVRLSTPLLGVLMLAEGEHEAAVDYLGRMILELAPDSRWADAARRNLAVAEAALGHTAKAIELLRADPSPQRFGSRLEAARLERASSAAAPR